MAAKNVSPEQMLEMIRAETKRNRDLCNETLGRELVEKSKRLQQISLMLTEPPVTQTELERLAQDVNKLQRETSTLEAKAKKVLSDADQKKL